MKKFAGLLLISLSIVSAASAEIAKKKIPCGHSRDVCFGADCGRNASGGIPVPYSKQIKDITLSGSLPTSSRLLKKLQMDTLQTAYSDASLADTYAQCDRSNCEDVAATCQLSLKLHKDISFVDVGSGKFTVSYPKAASTSVELLGDFKCSDCSISSVSKEQTCAHLKAELADGILESDLGKLQESMEVLEGRSCFRNGTFDNDMLRELEQNSASDYVAALE